MVEKIDHLRAKADAVAASGKHDKAIQKPHMWLRIGSLFAGKDVLDGQRSMPSTMCPLRMDKEGGARAPAVAYIPPDTSPLADAPASRQGESAFAQDECAVT